MERLLELADGLISHLDWFLTARSSSKVAEQPDEVGPTPPEHIAAYLECRGCGDLLAVRCSALIPGVRSHRCPLRVVSWRPGVRDGRITVGGLAGWQGVGLVPQVVCVHGVGQQLKGEDALAGEWVGALRDGMRRAGAAEAVLPSAGEVGFAFYGDVFRPAGRGLAVGDAWLTADDLDDFEGELLAAWWQGAASADPGVIAPGAVSLARVPGGVQRALRALSESAFFAGLAERALLHDLRQVRLYLTDPVIREAVQGRVAAAVDAGTQVLVGHSLGAVVAYEALCAHPEWPVRALVTMGAPLGIRNLIFDRLQPAPEQSGSGLAGRWPGGAEAWANVADAGDPVALVKDLRPLFGPRVECFEVSNGARAHAVGPYLTARETGAAITAGLGSPGAAR